MKKTLMAIGTAAGVLAGCTSAMAQQFSPCGAQVEAALKSHGLAASQLQDVVWETEFFANSRSQEMGGFQLQARPASCASGRLVMTLWRNCRVSSTTFSGDCHLEQASR